MLWTFITTAVLLSTAGANDLVTLSPPELSHLYKLASRDFQEGKVDSDDVQALWGEVQVLTQIVYQSVRSRFNDDQWTPTKDETTRIARKLFEEQLTHFSEKRILGFRFFLFRDLQNARTRNHTRNAIEDYRSQVPASLAIASLYAQLKDIADRGVWFTRAKMAEEIDTSVEFEDEEIQMAFDSSFIEYLRKIDLKYTNPIPFFMRRFYTSLRRLVENRIHAKIPILEIPIEQLAEQIPSRPPLKQTVGIPDVEEAMQWLKDTYPLHHEVVVTNKIQGVPLHQIPHYFGRNPATLCWQALILLESRVKYHLPTK